jgi:hypothetical protein
MSSASLAVLPVLTADPDIDDGSLRGTLTVSPTAVLAIVRGAVRAQRLSVAEPKVEVVSTGDSLDISLRMGITYPDEPVGGLLDEIRSDVVPIVQRQLGRSIHRFDITITEMTNSP